MTDVATEPTDAPTGADPTPEDTATLDAGTYEVLRARLAERSAELTRRAEELNARRVEVFGGTELRLAGTERIRTENRCVPRDIVAVGDHMLFGCSTFLGMKAETAVTDVFACHRFTRDDDGIRFEPLPGPEVVRVLGGPAFERAFAELYRYYRDTHLLQLRRVTGRLLAVFQVGDRITDVRVLRWTVRPDGTLEYVDNKGEREHVFPPAHDFDWHETTRDQHVSGRHPHISVDDEVFVETIGGHLTIKVENNTETGEGIYREPVDEPHQSLGDADIHFARVGALILLRIRPYNETRWRHLVFNTRTKDVVRLDAIGQACQRLPEDQGIVFPGGYYLVTGATKTFDTDVADLEFESVVRSPNGEDVLYVFHARGSGHTLLLPYNVIRKEIATPLPCHGFSLFEDGRLVLFRGVSDEPARVHPLQVWQTPFVSDTHAAAQPVGTGPLERIGNAELVRGISDALSVSRIVAEMTPATGTFETLIATCQRTVDLYPWLGDADVGDLRTPIGEAQATAEQVLAEFETVQQLRQQATAALAEAAERTAGLLRHARSAAPRSADAWVTQLAELRRAQGHLVSLRETRYIDTDRITALDAEIEEELSATARRAVAFLGRDDAFDDYHAEVDRLVADAGAIAKVADGTRVGDRLSELTGNLETVTEVVGSLDIADATVRTGILERVAEVLGGVNRARATLEARRRELADQEGRAEFAAELALLGQAITSALASADTPDTCDEHLGRLQLQVETLESRFADFDDFLTQLADKREDVYEAFSARKQTLLDERARRADRLADSAERILTSVRRRVAQLESLDDINTYFASDTMVRRLRATAEELRELGETVRAEELDGRIAAARQEAGRALRDRQDLFDGGGDTIRLGRHHFAVNTQPIDLTLVPHDGEMTLAVTGTDFRAPIRDASFQQTREYWDQLLVSETPEVYRGEYLAATLLAEAEAGTGDLSLPTLYRALATDGSTDRAADGATGDGPATGGATVDGPATLPLVRRTAETRYDEGYERGVHDHDAAAILDALLRLRAGADLLRYPPAARAAAQLLWVYGATEEQRATWTARARSLARAREVFGLARSEAVAALAAELSTAAATFLDGAGLAEDTGDDLADNTDLAGEYLVEEIAAGTPGFVTGAGARTLLDRFGRALGGAHAELTESLRALGEDPASLRTRYQLVSAWLDSYLSATDAPADRSDPRDVLLDRPEAIAVELCGRALERRNSSAALTERVTGLLGTHPRITERHLDVRVDELLARVRRFAAARVPGFRAYHRRRNELVAAERDRLRLPEYQPSVMSGFVRNQLLDQVYLPLVGDNLARQLGAAGDAKRTDQSGLLLLISPPGYGKTTLMEYVANRLGLVFVKINGPALGHTITSVDPAEAPNATARQEVEKISFALEMGNNVLLYLDDIQHTSPELLQRFISLCDAQRRMEGVWDGGTRTYDLRGKRFAVCMAGNPYTESGRRFRIPDMLANRADVWNLGDVLSGREDLFALSYIENALTSNPTLAPLSTRERGDVELLVRLARGDDTVRADQLSHPYSAAELDQVTSVLRKLLRVQRVVLSVNQTYIESAAQDDAARTEPPFLLQGSYRNMNAMTERVVPVMNDAELDTLIDDHYRGEAQTLTSDAEANLLKLGELRGTLTAEQTARWTEVKDAYRRAKALAGNGDDPLGRAVGAVGLLADQVGAVRTAIERASETR